MGEMGQRGLPTVKGLEGVLGLELGGNVSDLMAASLLEPVSEFLGRPGKAFRGRLVTYAFCAAAGKNPNTLTQEETELTQLGATVLEQIHAGSLMVDDIQDDSDFRRGQPTAHRIHGVPLALNAGNWLYFWPLDQLREKGFSESVELAMYRVCHQALLRAHFGQALDLGVSVQKLDQKRVAEVCLSSLELKTGALMELAVAMGGVLGNGTPQVMQILRNFGKRFGVALQMLDDIGNVTGIKLSSTDPKQFEDLRLGRPSWVWAVAAKNLSPENYSKFVMAVSATSPLQS